MSQTTKISQLDMYDLFLIGMKAQPHIFDPFFGNPWEILVVFYQNNPFYFYQKSRLPSP